MHSNVLYTHFSLSALSKARVDVGVGIKDKMQCTDQDRFVQVPYKYTPIHTPTAR